LIRALIPGAGQVPVHQDEIFESRDGLCGFPETIKNEARCRSSSFQEELTMKKTAIALATVAALGAATVAAPTKAEARGWGWGPGIGIGLAAGAIGAGIAASTWPGYAYGGYYGPGYGYYGPRYYRPAYAYYGGPVYYGGPRIYRHRYWHRRHW
jgi:hypothetical protein